MTVQNVVLCTHGNNPQFCPSCKLPPITQCHVCHELTQTLIHELHGNQCSAKREAGWPLCCNECAFRLKVWLKIQTPRGEGEASGTVSPSTDSRSSDVRPLQCEHIGASVEEKPPPGPVL